MTISVPELFLNNLLLVFKIPDPELDVLDPSFNLFLSNLYLLASTFQLPTNKEAQAKQNKYQNAFSVVLKLDKESRVI